LVLYVDLFSAEGNGKKNTIKKF